MYWAIVDFDDEAIAEDIDVGFSKGEEPTVHELESKASVSSWKEIRSSLLSAATAAESLPKDQKCQCSEAALLRCTRCSPGAYFCENCFLALHCQLNSFHVAEKWEVSQIVPFNLIPTSNNLYR